MISLDALIDLIGSNAADAVVLEYPGERIPTLLSSQASYRRRRIVALHVMGLPPNVIAERVGCSPRRVRQVITEEDRP